MIAAAQLALAADVARCVAASRVHYYLVSRATPLKRGSVGQTQMSAIERGLSETWYYIVVFGGFVQGSVVLAFAVVTLFGSFTRRRRAVVGRFLRFLNFNAALLLTGSAASVVWGAVAWERWYVQADPVVTFQPVFPFGQYVLDATFGAFRGGLRNGASLTQLQLLWFSLALGVWSSAVWLHRKLLRALSCLAARRQIVAS